MVIELVDDPTIWFNEPLFKRTIHPATSPRPSAGVTRKVWTAMVPDEPYRAKGLCREGNFPLTPCTFVVVPPLLIPSAIHFLAFKFGATFAKSTSLTYSSLTSSASVTAARRFCLITQPRHRGSARARGCAVRGSASASASASAYVSAAMVGSVSVG